MQKILGVVVDPVDPRLAFIFFACTRERVSAVCRNHLYASGEGVEGPVDFT